jgi:hypothetical protein
VDAGPAPSAGPVSGKVSDLQESFEIRPNRPGATEAVITVFDTRRPASGEVTGVSVRVRTKPSVAAVPLGDGHWVAQLPYLHQGSSAIRVVANRDGAPDVATTYRWTVASAGAIPRTWVSRASLRPGLRWACLLLTAGVSAAWAVVLLRRRRRRRRWATTLAVAMLADAGRETVRPPRVLTTVGRR